MGTAEGGTGEGTFLFRRTSVVLCKTMDYVSQHHVDPECTQMCGICGNYNGEPEDELLMSSDELADNDLEFVKSWKDNDIDRE